MTLTSFSIVDSSSVRSQGISSRLLLRKLNHLTLGGRLSVGRVGKCLVIK